MVLLRRCLKRRFAVSDQPHPRAANNILMLNDGVAILSSAGLLHTPLNLNLEFDTLEVVCVRNCICLVLLSSVGNQFYSFIYDPGHVTTTFFDELSEVPQIVVTFSAPLIFPSDYDIGTECDLGFHARTHRAYVLRIHRQT